MNIKYLGRALVVFLVNWSGMASASEAFPEKYSLRCWDGTFFYNRLEVEKAGENIIIEASGSAVDIFLKARGKGNELSPFVNLEVPASSCRISTSDAKLLRCHVKDARIELGTPTKEQPIEVIQLDNLEINLRRVIEVSEADNAPFTGYELQLIDSIRQRDILLSQPYFYEWSGGDQREKCQLNNNEGRNL